jgi:hypothetical protein
MIAFYIMGLSMQILRNALFVDSTDSIIEKTAVMMRTTTEKEEKAGPKVVLILSYNSSFEVLVCKQGGVKIIVMAQKEA